MPDPADAFRPQSLAEELANHPEADRYIDDIAALTVERGQNPSWKAVRAGLMEFGIQVGVTENPIKAIVEKRANALR